MKNPEKGLFIAGTDTDVGKTYVASLLAKSLLSKGTRVGVYKPIASGCFNDNGHLRSEDAWQLWHAAGRPKTLHDVTPQCFAAALAPNLAARKENKSVDRKLLRSGIEVWSDREVVLVEGVGGLMSPISDEDLVADVAVDFGYPIIVVVPNVLGAINQTLQILVVAQKYNLDVAGIVINDVCETNDESAESNRAEIERLVTVPILAQVAFGATQIAHIPIVGCE